MLGSHSLFMQPFAIGQVDIPQLGRPLTVHLIGDIAGNPHWKGDDEEGTFAAVSSNSEHSQRGHGELVVAVECAFELGSAGRVVTYQVEALAARVANDQPGKSAVSVDDHSWEDVFGKRREDAAGVAKLVAAEEQVFRAVSNGCGYVEACGEVGQAIGNVEAKGLASA